MADEDTSYYSFLPWVRQGIGAQIKPEDTASPPPERPKVKLSLTLEGTPEVVGEPVSLVVSKQVSLYGPGDVIGIDRRAVVRVEPPNWVTDFEPNYVASIDFYDEDLPWRFTPPLKATESNPARLRPWICLIVLAEGEFEKMPFPPKQGDRYPNRPLPAIRLVGNPPLPPSGQTWAWAHVHVNAELSLLKPMQDLCDKLAENPDLAFSRLICPRRLRPKTAYHAFVIPAFEVGRLAGLGVDTTGKDGLIAAWGGAEQTEFPVYYRWYFRTGERGDFEYQVKLLQPRTLDTAIGTRLMDCQDPAPTMETPGFVLGLEGALMTNSAASTEWPSRDSNEPPEFQQKLIHYLDLSYELQTGTDDDPAVTAPVYGCWHAGARSVGNYVARPWWQHWKERWLDELNLDPRWRVAAGLGALVVQQNQEKYMEAAWRQVGQIKAVNRVLKHAQLAREISAVYYARNLKALAPDAQLWITRSVHARVLKDDHAPTIWQTLRDSYLGQGALDWGFRKLVRPRGPLMCRLAGGQSMPAYQFLAAIDSGRITAATEKRPAENMFTVRRTAESLIPAKRNAILGMLAEEKMTRKQIEQTPPPQGFKVTLPGQSMEVGQADSFRAALLDAHARLQSKMPAPALRTKNVISNAANRMQAALDPQTTIQARIQASCASLAEYQAAAQDPLAPVMACPDFPEPMYKALRDLSLDLLSPNLGLIPPNTVAMLETNRRFIEAYMVGLNHEMNRELLWREYPTDQRGTCFRQFWEAIGPVNAETAAQQKDIKPISAWDTDSVLGDHDPRELSQEKENRIVLVIRGDFLKKFPLAAINARRAKWKVQEPKGREPDFNGISLDPIFRADVGTDITFLGFDLTKDQACHENGGLGWFIVFQERPGELRFGLDEASGPVIQDADTWSDLSWGHLAANQGDFDQFEYVDLTPPLDRPQKQPHVTNSGGIQWFNHSADMACIFYQQPMRVAIHAKYLLG